MIRAALALLAAAPVAAQVATVTPSVADPGVKQFDEPSIAVAGPAGAPLAVFLTGTGGRPRGASVIIGAIAKQGYPVLALEYDDEPAVSQVCPRDPDPACSADFREMRATGTGASRAVSNPPAEGIVARLVAALRYLARKDPRWAGYLDGDQPRWDRLLLSGLSQGAGMAAWLAKQHEVARVVLFSSPWDWTGPDRRPAPWLSRPGATPVDRWWAEYNARENTAPALRRAYAALGLPADHVLVFSLDLPAGFHPAGPAAQNPYHGITIRDERYAPQWATMFGTSAATAR